MENPELTYTLCSVEEIPENEARGFSMPGQGSIFAIKKDGRVHVYRNNCPHLGVELEMREDDFLDSDKAFIQCSTHGALFVIESGECVAGPCTGKALESVPFHIKEGRIILTTPA